MLNEADRFQKDFCPDCNVQLEEVYFTEEEYKYDPNFQRYFKTGRKRIAIDYFICPRCLQKTIVDGDYKAIAWSII